MLSSAIELSNLVKQQQSVTWTDTRSVDNYIMEMRKIVEKISLENQSLANYHQAISNKVKRSLPAYFINYFRVTRVERNFRL